jgi:hypothetical protein
VLAIANGPITAKDGKKDVRRIVVPHHVPIGNEESMRAIDEKTSPLSGRRYNPGSGPQGLLVNQFVVVLGLGHRAIHDHPEGKPRRQHTKKNLRLHAGLSMSVTAIAPLHIC